MRVEEMIAVRAVPARTRRALLAVAEMRRWVAPDVTVAPAAGAAVLAAVLETGDRFALDVMGGLRFEYLVEGITDRDVAFTFTGAWSGREKWSFVPDGAETVVRRAYEADDASLVAMVAWQTLGRGLVALHYRMELARFRTHCERDPGDGGEIQPGPAAAPVLPEPGTSDGALPFPVDDG